jgi:adenylate cyclase
VSVQLVDTEAGLQLWTQRFDRQVDDLFAIQDEITDAIAGAIAPAIERFEQRRADTAPPTEVDAWLVYQKGMSIATERAEHKMVEAIEYFDRAHELDAKFTPALAMSAITWMILAYVYRSDQADEINRVARAKADLALSIDPSDPLAMSADARVLLDTGHHAQAMAQAKKAVAVNPNNAFVQQRAAHTALVSANFDDCLYHSDRVLALSPFDPAEHIVRAFKALALCLKGEFPASRDAYLAINNPKRLNFGQRTVDALILMKLGRMEEARASIAEIKAEFPQLSISIIARGNRNFAPDFVNPVLEGLRELGVPEE